MKKHRAFRRYRRTQRRRGKLIANWIWIKRKVVPLTGLSQLGPSGTNKGGLLDEEKNTIAKRRKGVGGGGGGGGGLCPGQHKHPMSRV